MDSKNLFARGHSSCDVLSVYNKVRVNSKTPFSNSGHDAARWRPGFRGFRLVMKRSIICCREWGFAFAKVRVSLTRVAMWLQDLGLLSEERWRDLPNKDQIEGVSLESMQSPFGLLERLPSPARLELTPSRYDLGPEPLGASPARWND